MAKYYPIPKKLFHPKIIHLYDIVALVVMFAVALTVLPLGTTLDLSVGFNEKSQAYLDYERSQINDMVESAGVRVSYIEKLFESTTIQNGGTVYWSNDKEYWFYETGEKGLTYYPVVFGKAEEDQPETPFLAEEELPRGMITSGFYLSVGEDDRICFDNLEGLAGWSDHYVDRSKANPEEMTKILLAGSERNLTVAEAALVWVMAQERTLIGFADKTAWFAVPGEAGMQILKGTKKGIEEITVIDGVVTNTMVADNKFLFYVQDGNVTIRNLETMEGLYFPNTTDWKDMGPVRQLAYVKMKDGFIRLYTLNGSYATYTDFSGNGTENRGTKRMSNIDCKNYTEIFTTREDNRFTLWFQDIGQIVWKHEEG